VAEPKNLGTSRVTGDITCRKCGYKGEAETYDPCIGYNDIRCPECRSTDNEHNSIFTKNIALRGPGTSIDLDRYRGKSNSD